MTARRRGTAVAVLAALAALVVCAAPAGADTTLPPGSVRLGPALGAPGDVTDLALGADRFAEVVPGDGLYLAPVTGGAPRASLAGVTDITSAAGASLLVRVSTSVVDSHIEWFDMRTGAHGVPPRTWAAAAPGGGYYTDPAADGTAHLYRQTTAGSVTDYGPLPAGFGLDAQVVPDVAGAGAVAVVGSPGGFFAVSWYAGPDATPVPVDLGGHDGSVDCPVLRAAVLGCRDFEDDTSDVLALRLRVAAPATVVTTASEDDDGGIVRIAVDDRATAVVSDTADRYDTYYQAALYPVAGGRVGLAASDLPLVTDGQEFFAPTGPGRDGTTTEIRAWTDTGASRVAGPVPSVAPVISTVDLTDGRVAWSDDRQGGSTWTAVVQQSGRTVTLGRAIRLGGAVGEVAVSGTRTLYPSDVFSLAVRVGTGPAQTVPGCTATGELISNGDPEFDEVDYSAWSISGTRVVCARYGRPPQEDSLLVVDLVTGAVTDLTATLGAVVSNSGVSQQVSGDAMVFTRADNSIARLNLVTGAVDDVAPASPSLILNVRIFGDDVVWSVDPGSLSPHFAVRDMATGAPAVVLAGYAGTLSTGGLVFSPTGDTSKFRRWDGTVESLPTGGLVAGPTRLFSATAVGGGYGTEYLAPLPFPIADQPRSLGNPVVSAGLSPGQRPWTLDLPTSASLTACAVRITQGVATVRTLPCDADSATSGDVVVSWDGTGDDGRQVPVGDYRWRVTAFHGSLPLLAVDGSATQTGGTVTVSR